MGTCGPEFAYAFAAAGSKDGGGTAGVGIAMALFAGAAFFCFAGLNHARYTFALVEAQHG
jgi:hypothetical protein